ncbi:type I-E CRISPR-associated endonuclease Cas1e [Corynebacterium sp. CCM 8835]|uniref:CRISPR-associated endonuclease Cas1 n=2 Tax=Corynebacterium antarcticum TaxID=2800405 RepID=A0A9Q4GK87_9CORY|nr:type I-E CRISPR-associated endonuclease Cas1e [Corynebacterium antarcticum]MCK7642060.1 type I-E CRISPR-associated endonuclease Cas1e [Corynebacterium antarcticum]MCK7659840.1 type I-E CRISPR-associated endonuclease Cas1e [Corynebacterium antarcticum]MCL0245285.1 type I-E CRISPR-associated endonuclease Cas1e [Corynebacterium antarcticum]MCX7537682.1 type I-E CRISPR-associated endonuclease Cas1e [Corynebacterium antarcticum]MCX7539166.1 type I-E CRISPR-associated endonuclease Cas1e [Coryneba
MARGLGVGKPTRSSELTRAVDRITFVYLEHCTIGRDDGALTATTEKGTLHIPSSALGVLILGPGTRVTHQAMLVAADSGTSVIWCGENGVRYYAHGRPLGRSTRLLERQAALVSNTRTRLKVARRMYEMRFHGESTNGLTMQQLRGREGARIRDVYRRLSEETGVKWDKRQYDPEDFLASDDINQALSAAHAALYGVVHSVIVALGCSPGLGFVHKGHDRSFVYDIADLYKAEVTIPVAFEAVARMNNEDITPDILASEIRRKCRDLFREKKLLTRGVHDINHLLVPDEISEDNPPPAVIELWDDKLESVEAGKNYSLDS